MYILIAILAFGILIATHELGHFIAAKSLGIKVNEYSVGMGPAIFKKQKGDTLYALRILPIGGYCAMEGEDEDSGDPRAFSVQKPWKKLIVLIAGAATNFLTGVLVVLIMFSGYDSFVSNTVGKITEPLYENEESGLMLGDKIVSVDGHWVMYAEDVITMITRANGKNVDLVIDRDGKKLTLSDFPLMLRTYDTEDGQQTQNYGVYFYGIEGTPITRLKYSLYCSMNFVRNVWMGLEDLIAGKVGIKDMSGPVGIVSTINDVAHQSESTKDALFNVVYICAFIAVNLAVMNLLPLPALDGGRIFAIIVTEVFFFLTKKRIDPKYEGYIHTIGFVLLLALMAVVMFNDIRRLI